MSFGIFPKLVCATAAALMFGTVAAQASEATLLADRAGFLLGHALRCGIEDARLRRSEAVIGEAIAAFALDDEDTQTAKSGFTERVLASALAELLGDPVPSCRTVGAELARLEQRRPAMAQPGKREEEMARNNRSKLEAARSAGAAEAKRTKARKPATTRPEELTPERRAKLELKRAAPRDGCDGRPWPPPCSEGDASRHRSQDASRRYGAKG